jgi:hypothetical protein
MTAPVITGGSITGVALSGNTLTNPVITGGSINNTTVGATTRSTGAFTTLASNGATTFTAGTASTTTTTGTAVITGGLGVSGRINAANFDGIVGANTAAAGNFTTLGATGVATFSAGTNSAPAITTTGDTNTGIYFPAADTIAFTEGGVESMRITSAGDVGIGTASPAAKLQVNTGAVGTVGQIIQMFASQTADVLRVTRSDTNLSLQFTPTGQLSIGDISTPAATTITTGPATTTNANLKITGSNVGNPNLLLQSMNGGGGSLGGPTSFVYFGDNNRALSYIGGTKVNAFASNASSDLVFGTTSDISTVAVTERMRITSAGLVGIGTSSPSTKLDVVGTFKTSDNSTVANTGATRYLNVGDATPPANVDTLQHTFTGLGVIAAQRVSTGQADYGYNWYYYGGFKSRTNGVAYRLTTGEIAGQIDLQIAPAPGSADAALTFTKVFLVQKDKSIALQGTIPQTGTGITFPATQSASSDANTLDDYEEGTWTPNEGAGLVVVGAFSSSGVYTKVGRLVTVRGTVQGATSVASTGGGIICSNLPFTSTSGFPNFDVGSASNNVPSAGSQVLISSATVYAVTAIAATSSISFTITYNV